MLNISKGNMYEWVTHTWNVIKGKCYHDCSYCYMKRWGNLKDVRFDKSELKTDLGRDKFIFVGSSCDMWANDIPDEWLVLIFQCISKFNNKYLFQSKNPGRFHCLPIKNDFIYCTTIETNRFYKDIMGNSPKPEERAYMMPLENYITIEPILDFDLIQLTSYLQWSKPKQINIGADSGNNKLPEPPKEKILELIFELEKFTIVKQKKNLNRLLK